MRATATVGNNRIVVYTSAGPSDFAQAVVNCKSVLGAKFQKNPGGKSYWHYPLSIDTCHQLRKAFGDALTVSNTLANWYRANRELASHQASLAAGQDAELSRVPQGFAEWLRGYQRAGAKWIANGYRDAGLVADKPGVGKTPETIAGLLEAGISGPVLVVCPKASVRLVWGKEMAQHLPDVPTYLVQGKRDKREDLVERFRRDVKRDPNGLRVMVVVAEMLRVELGNPCVVKKSGRKVGGLCKPRAFGFECPHDQPKVDRKKWVPVSWSFPELFDPNALGGGWAAVVLDESHKLLGSLTVTRGNLMGRGLKMLPTRPGYRRYALSGTPFGKGGRVEGMFGTLHWLWPDEYSSYWRWAAKWFNIEEKTINRFGKTVRKIAGLKGLSASASPGEEEEAWEEFLAALGPRILRRTKDEVLKDLPPKTYVEVVCEVVGRQKKQLEDLRDWAEVRTRNGVITANGTLALLTRERQVANGELTVDDAGQAHYAEDPDSGKLDRLWEALEARGILDGQPGGKIVISSMFNEFLDTIAAQLRKDKVPFFQYDGRVPASKRDEMVRRWQSDSTTTRVFLLNTMAGGVSITLDAADEMHIMDEHPDPGVNEQLEDRLHRASRIHKVFIFYYRTEGSVDYRKAHDVEYRRRVQHAVLDGGRGVDYVRNMLTEAQLEDL